MSDQSTQRPAAFTALVALIDHLLSDPRTAHLAKGGIWGVHEGKQISIIQHVESDDPQAVLDYLSSTLGGTFAADGPAGEAYIWNVMAIKWQGASVEMKLAAPGLSAEDQLRARVAELEAELAAKAKVPDSLPRCSVCTFAPAYCTCFGKTHRFDAERLGVSDAKRRLANCVGCGQPRTAVCHAEAGEPA